MDILSSTGNQGVPPTRSSSRLSDTTLRDINVENISKAFATKTAAGRAALIERLSHPTTDVAVIDARISEIRKVRTACKANATAINAALAVLRETEADVQALTTLHNDKRHIEYYNQILWSPTSFTQRLNTYSWLTEAIIFFRTLFLPGLSLIMPLSILIMPFILFHYVIKEPLTWNGYVSMISAALKKAMPSVLGAPRFAARGGVIAAGEHIAHLIVGAGVFIGSIWNQISHAKAMRHTVADMRTRAQAVRRMTDAVQELSRLVGVTIQIPVWPAGDMGVFGAAWNRPALTEELLGSAAHLDMLVAIAALKRTCFPVHAKEMRITDLYHPGTGSKRVLNSLAMTDSHHILLTGPNRGGKSTMLKSIGAAVLMSQTVGVVFARRARIPVFHAIITALNPTDKLGQLSLFEAEIEFAKEVRHTIREESGPVFLMMDEIFHGTNAHDGVTASQVFLDDLYKMGERVFSVISTHYMGLPERYGKVSTQNLCMGATVDPANPDRIIYTYRLKQGINRLSSVREILRERGLLVETAEGEEDRRG